MKTNFDFFIECYVKGYTSALKEESVSAIHKVNVICK